MDFKQYPSYKDSGVEWLGEVPEHWDLKRFKYILEEINERSELGDETLLSVSEYYGVKPRKETIDEGDILSRAESLSGYKKCKSGDLVMNIMLAWKRGLGVTKFDGIVSPAYAVFRLFSHNYSEDYIHYLLRTDTYTNYFKSFSTGIMNSRLRLYPEYFGNLTNISPSLKEQTQIVSFLDSETSRIDNLIAKQEKLIEKLEEHRKSIISHAVTKGLDPNVPMKDSGVEWLGDIPENWNVYPFSYLFKRKEITQKANEQLLSVYLDRGVILYSDGGGLVHKPADSLDKYQLVEVNDFVMNNQQAWRGSVGISPYQGIVSPAYLVFSPHQELCNPKFFKYCLRDKKIVDQFMISSMSVGTIQRQIKGHLLKKIKLSVPPLVEQNAIANFLDSETSRIDNLIAKQEKLIEKLKEYRSTIISHAVTGTIDVRDLVA